MRMEPLNASQKLDQEAVNTIRCLAADTIQKANSGHPGAPMGMAPVANALFSKIMNFSPKNPKWMNRDRFVLSNGHACALQYIMLHLTGYNLSMDDLKAFRQFNSKTPGHPENFHTEGVEVCTGPLGQGLSNAVGMAIAQSHLAEKFNKSGFELFDHYTYVLTGDGCLMEGITGEASSLAGHLGLKNLIVFYDDNEISIDGSTNLAFTEDVGMRYQAYGWNVMTIESGDCAFAEKFEAAVAMAKAQSKPTIIKMKTTIGYGSLKEGSEKTHGAPLGADDIKGLKTKFGMNPDQSFSVGQDVYTRFQSHGKDGDIKAANWNTLLNSYTQKFPELAAELKNRIAGKVTEGWKNVLPTWDADAKKATRVYSGECLSKLCAHCPELMGGCADLAPSCNSKHMEDYQKENPGGRYLRFGVREHAMAAVCNGLAAYGCFTPFAATFAVFFGYAWGAVRLSALSKFPVLYIGTHDSIDLGEDGPTHQPVEMMSLFRSTPNLLTVRPADGNEVAGGYSVFMENRTRPTVLILSRSGAPMLAGSCRDKVAKGAYVITEDPGFTVCLTGTGQEVNLCVEAKAVLNAKGIKVRVVSMPCWELFEEQPQSYRESVIPAAGKGVTRVWVECATTGFGVDRYSDVQVVMNSFGGSAPMKDLRNHFGFTKEKVAEKVLKALGK